tara:strand:- start:22 stop:228 length:207 start_codon:yes stop_codon:yes gene_type:complete
MVFGYNVKEEATEIKETLKSSRGNMITLIIAGVVGGIITRYVVPKRITEGGLFDRLKSWMEGDEYYDE